MATDHENDGRSLESLVRDQPTSGQQMDHLDVDSGSQSKVSALGGDPACWAHMDRKDSGLTDYAWAPDEEQGQG